MTLPAERPRLTYAEYLQREAQVDFLAEFLDGEVWLMSGGTAAHAQLTSNVTITLGSALRGRPCRVYAESLRVYLPARNEGTYPDLKVICGPPEHHEVDPIAVINPTMLVEVLSDSTEQFDRGSKFARYRTLESLQAYLLVDQHQPRLELFERNPDGSWLFTVAEAGETLQVRALEIELAVDEVYEDVELTPRQRPQERAEG